MIGVVWVSMKVFCFVLQHGRRTSPSGPWYYFGKEQWKRKVAEVLWERVVNTSRRLGNDGRRKVSSRSGEGSVMSECWIECRDARKR